MGKGLSRHTGASISISRIIVRLALVLSVLAVVVIFLLAQSAGTANKMMSVEKKVLSNIPSNILPNYSATSFRSFDDQTNLSGWFFKTEDPISTVILVHDTGSNRMPFDVDTVDLVEDLLKAKYNVFLFDLRNSGESEGTISGYGYLEWQDVIGAIEHVRKISVTTNVILYGVGSGCAASLLAIDKLPDPAEYGREYDKKIENLVFDRSYVVGVILDSPAKDTDDYIKPLVRESGGLGMITQYTVPYAIRMSAGEGSSLDLSAKISQLPIPVCILYGDQDTFIGAGKISQIVTERKRLHPNTTSSYVFSGAGYVGSYETDPAEYRNDILDFLAANFE